MCKILLFLALLPVIALADTDNLSELVIDPCQTQVDGVFIPNARGCAWFNRCSGKKSIEGRCPPDLIFNAAKSLCDYPENVECDLDDRVVDTTCTGSGIKFLPSLYSCSKYTVCFDGLIQDRSCDAGLHFSPFDNACVEPRLAECKIDQAICGSKGTPWNPWFVANSRDCASYFLCLGSTSVSMRCAPGFQFDTVKNWCDLESKVKCVSVLPEQPAIPEQIRTDCPNRPGLTFEAHPENCSFYFICSNGESNLQFCSTGLIFDILTRRCTLPTNGTCVIDVTTPAPTTTPASTPSISTTTESS